MRDRERSRSSLYAAPAAATAAFDAESVLAVHAR
jgi:hypothetical protein